MLSSALRAAGRKCLAAAILPILLASVAVGGPTSAAATFSFNGGFEDKGSGGTVQGWTQSAGTGGTASVATSPVRSGQASLKIVDSNSSRAFGMLSSGVPVTPGANYQTTAHLWVTSGTPTLYLYFYAANGTKLAETSQDYPSLTSGKWNAVSLSATAPPGAATARVLAYSGIARTSTFFIDDVGIVEARRPDIASLGPAFRSVNLRFAATDVLANGTPVGYLLSEGVPVTFNAVDLRTGALIDSHNLPLESSASAIAVAADHRVYFSARGAVNRGALWRYDPLKRQVQQLRTSIVGEQLILDLAIDGEVIYGSTYPNAKLFSYNISTGTVRDYGRVVEGSDYAWGLGVVKGSVWVGTGPAPRLLEIDPKSGAKTDVALPDPIRKNAEFITKVEQHGDLVMIGYTPGAATNTAVFDLVQRRWLSTLDRGAIPWTQEESDGRLYAMVRNTLHSVDLTNLRSTNLGLEESRIASEFPGTKTLSIVDLGTPAFPGPTVVGIRNDGRIWRYNIKSRTHDVLTNRAVGSSAIVHSLGTAGDGHVLAGAFLSTGGITRINTKTNGLVQLSGPVQADRVAAHEGLTVVGTYPSAEYYVGDPTAEWAWGTNPRRLFRTDAAYRQDRPVALIAAGDRMAAGTIPKYGELGGSLTIFDPRSGEVSVHRNIVPDQSVTTLTFREGLIIGGTSIYGGLSSKPTQKEAKLFVWDARSNRLIRTLAVAKGATVIHGLTFDREGHLWGLADKGIVFEYDIDNQRILRTLSTAARAGNIFGQNSELYSHPRNGLIYGSADGRLFQIDPRTGQLTTLVENKALQSTMDPTGAIYFADRTEIYRYQP